jgi:hypothetical protein
MRYRYDEDDDAYDDAVAEMRAYRMWKRRELDDTPIEYHDRLNLSYERFESLAEESEDEEEGEEDE